MTRPRSTACENDLEEFYHLLKVANERQGRNERIKSERAFRRAQHAARVATLALERAKRLSDRIAGKAVAIEPLPLP